jgi:hypothetical protein
LTVPVASRGEAAAGRDRLPPTEVTVRADRIKKPIVIKSKRKLSLLFDVTFDCANFPGKSSKKTPGLEDDRFTATVTLSALGGDADAHPIDDVCPRQVTPPA